MRKLFFLSMICYFFGTLVRTQNTNTTTQTTCDITAYNEACYTNNKNCAFVESRKDTNKYYACLAVQPKDCNFFCNYFNELNIQGGITSVFCVCNGIKYPTNSG